MAQLKKNWTLNPQAFRQFLNWLDQGVDSHGERYLEIRRRLAHYFDRRNCLSSEELADETLNRVARKLEEKGEIVGASSAHYCYIVAKFVLLESARRSEHYQTSLDHTHLPGRVMAAGTRTIAGITTTATTTATTIASRR